MTNEQIIDKLKDDNENEIWKDVIGYEGLYQVSNLGNVKSYNSNRFKNGLILKQGTSKKGYKVIYFIKDRIKKTLSVHRLVAISFIENTYDKPQVNHINGIKYDNNIDNLEWVTNSENMKHAFVNGLKSFSEKRRNAMNKKVIDNDNGKIYQSAKDASQYFKINYHTLCNQLNGHRKNYTSLKYI